MPSPSTAVPERRSLHLAVASVAVLATLLLGACASAGAPMPEIAAEINATRDLHTSRFLPGDTVAIRFPHDPTYDQSVRVDPNGEASFTLVGRKLVLGKLPDQVRDELEAAYAAKLTSKPDVSVNLIELVPTGPENAPNRVYHVTGEVRTPGAFPIGGHQVTLIDGLARAGGHLKATALLKQVLLVRFMPESNSWRSWKIDARPDEWGGANQIFLQANDLVYVPNTPIDDVNIWVDQYIRLMIPFPYLIPPSVWSTP